MSTLTILKTLQVDYLRYDNFRERMMARWCELKAEKYKTSIRVLQSHDGLRNWYYDMWQIHVEKQFLLDNGDYLLYNIMDWQTAGDLIAMNAEEIERMEPLPILRMILKNKIKVKQ